jgi:hypothetical protein
MYAIASTYLNLWDVKIGSNLGGFFFAGLPPAFSGYH